MTTKHTPGPWVFNKKEEVWTISDASGYSMMGNERYYPWVPSSEADWILIAAAPDLLETLEELLRDPYLSDPINADRMARARAAIAKAEGQ